MIFKINIVTVDNPGWYIWIDNKKFGKDRKLYSYTHSEFDWVFISIQESQLVASGDSYKLLLIIKKIIKYLNINLILDDKLQELILWLQKWYANECDEYWEHLYGVHGEMDSQGSVVITIDLDETIWEEEYFEPQLKCEKIKTKFIIKCYFDELVDNLTVFKEWIKSID